jgi:hypothetical protein
MDKAPNIICAYTCYGRQYKSTVSLSICLLKRFLMVPRHIPHAQAQERNNLDLEKVYLRSKANTGTV